MLDVDGQPLRRRFTLRGDSLWWFAELYLHKHQAMLDVFRTIAAFETLRVRETAAFDPRRAGRTDRAACSARCSRTRNGIRYEGGAGGGGRCGTTAAARYDGRARSRWRRSSQRIRDTRHRRRDRHDRQSRPSFTGRSGGRGHGRKRRVVHRPGAQRTGSAAVGPALHTSASGLPQNFRARRWWHPVVHQTGGDPALFRLNRSLRDRRCTIRWRVWRDRHGLRRALCGSAALRTACDDRRLRLLARHSRGAGRDCAFSSGHGPHVRWMRRVPRSTAAARRRGHLCRSGRVGTRADTRSAPARNPECRAFSTVSSITRG